jgi:hypothetical protein
LGDGRLESVLKQTERFLRRLTRDHANKPREVVVLGCSASSCACADWSAGGHGGTLRPAFGRRRQFNVSPRLNAISLLSAALSYLWTEVRFVASNG